MPLVLKRKMLILLSAAGEGGVLSEIVSHLRPGRLIFPISMEKVYSAWEGKSK